MDLIIVLAQLVCEMFIPFIQIYVSVSVFEFSFRIFNGDANG